MKRMMRFILCVCTFSTFYLLILLLQRTSLSLLDHLLRSIHVDLDAAILLAASLGRVVGYGIAGTLSLDALHLGSADATGLQIGVNALGTADRQRLVDSIATRRVGVADDGDVAVLVVV